MPEDNKGYVADPRPRPTTRPPNPPAVNGRSNVRGRNEQGSSGGSSGKRVRIDVVDQPRQNSSALSRAGSAPPKALLPLRIVIFLMYGGMAALYPFFTLHMKSLSITLKETALISCFLTIFSCIGAPLVGALTDKIGHYRWMIMGLTAVHVFCHILLLGIPGFRFVEYFGTQEVHGINIQFPCQTRQNAIFSIEHQERLLCDALTTSSNDVNELQFDSCWTDCSGIHSSPSVCFLNGTGGRGPYCPKWSDLERQILKDLSFSWISDPQRPFNWETIQFHNDEGALLQSAHCYVRPPSHDPYSDPLPNCAVYCRATAVFTMRCRTGSAREGSPWLTLVAYFVLRLLGLTGLLSVLVILDTVALQIAREHGGTVGSHRMFSCLSYVVFPVISGLLMVEASNSQLVTEFFPAFMLFGGLSAVAALFGLFMNMPRQVARVETYRGTGNLLCSPQVIVLIMVMTVIGVASGYCASFLFWFLEAEFNMPKYLMGAGIGLASLLAIPVFYATERLIGAIGYAILLVVALLLNSARFLAYSYLSNLYLFFPIEILTAVVFGIIFVVPIYFSRLIAPAYFCALQTVMTAAMFGLGAAIGPLIGGFTISAYGHRISFRIFSTFFFVIAIFYLLLYCVLLRKTNLPAAPEPEVVTRILPRSAPPPQAPVSPTTGFRTSDLFPDEMETILYREKISPLAELDRGFDDPIYWHGSRPVSGIRAFL